MSSRVLITAIVASLGVSAGSTARADAAGATIRGRIVAADTGQPLRRARIEVSAAEPNIASDRNATTDAVGRYVISDIPTGKYNAPHQQQVDSLSFSASG